ncbi:MAG: hypothetical protein WCY37_03560 [Candidatus Dojkabacteria bacterium]
MSNSSSSSFVAIGVYRGKDADKLLEKFGVTEKELTSGEFSGSDIGYGAYVINDDNLVAYCGECDLICVGVPAEEILNDMSITEAKDFFAEKYNVPVENVQFICDESGWG